MTFRLLTTWHPIEAGRELRFVKVDRFESTTRRAVWIIPTPVKMGKLPPEASKEVKDDAGCD
jgi:hypothetical protein